METVVRYGTAHEQALLALLGAEPDWDTFTSEPALQRFRRALAESDTWVCVDNAAPCGYVRAIVDAFGVYVSELYLSPAHRGRGYGRAMLARIRAQHPDANVYVLSDEDAYYDRLGCRRIGSVYAL